jgi:hypothetical protein
VRIFQTLPLEKKIFLGGNFVIVWSESNKKNFWGKNLKTVCQNEYIQKYILTFILKSGMVFAMKDVLYKDIISQIKNGSIVIYHDIYHDRDTISHGTVTGFEKCKWQGLIEDGYGYNDDSCSICTGRISVDNRTAKCMSYDGKYSLILKVEDEFLSNEEFEI